MLFPRGVVSAHDALDEDGPGAGRRSLSISSATQPPMNATATLIGARDRCRQSSDRRSLQLRAGRAVELLGTSSCSLPAIRRSAKWSHESTGRGVEWDRRRWVLVLATCEHSSASLKAAFQRSWNSRVRAPRARSTVPIPCHLKRSRAGADLQPTMRNPAIPEVTPIGRTAPRRSSTRQRPSVSERRISKVAPDPCFA